MKCYKGVDKVTHELLENSIKIIHCYVQYKQIESVETFKGEPKNNMIEHSEEE